MLNKISDISKIYEIKEKIGSGGFSTVYKALDKISKKKFALKMIHKKDIEDGNKKKYLYNNIIREIKLMKVCCCNNIVKLYDSFETESDYVLVLELCDTDILSFIKNQKEYQGNLYFIQNIFLELNNAFKIIYENKIIHRDIKPENIYLKFENNKIIPKLGDFGISRFDNEENEINEIDFEFLTKTIVGTPEYLAPEIAMNEKYNNKCDLYSLGITLYKLCFLKSPYNGLASLAIKSKNKNKEIWKESGLKSFDNLIRGLIERNPKERLDWEDYFNHSFFKEDLKNLKNISIESKNEINQENKNDNLDKICNIAKSILDIMKIPNAYTDNKSPRISNILYYDENINKHLEDIHQDCDYFERKTQGAFILSSNIFSLNLVMEEIKKYNRKYDDRVIFNLIVTGSKCQKVMDNLIEYKYDEFIQKVCIYCMKIDKYSYLQKKYSKIIGIYNVPDQVVKFIENVSNEKTKEFPMLKIINYNDYINVYHDRHEKISHFYGNLTKETYEKSLQKLEKFIDSKNDEELKIQKKELIESFKTFDLEKDIEMLDKLIIREYSKNTFYGDLNNWLRTLDNQTYEIIAYYTARLMYSLNNYALKTNNFYSKKAIIFRGARTNYINLLPFERLQGKIILLSSFTSTSEDETLAVDWSGRKRAKEIFNEYQKFSVIYKITNIVKNNCISCGINIQDIARFDEKEILFQPFTFYLVKKVDFNFDEKTVDIELETISKKEILEEKIREGKKAVYDKISNLIIIDENKK